MAGVCGVAGWWWNVPATIADPFSVPIFVALGMSSIAPLEIMGSNWNKWNVITNGTNPEFWLNVSNGIKEEYFGQMATSEREAEMRTFFGVRDGKTG